jgi:flagellar hook-length control protein FliK
MQQTMNDPKQSPPDPAVMQTTQTARDVAASQTLPTPSLMERIDQARLTNRVAGAFRSLANQSGTIRMKLHPEELGALTIRMQIEAGKVSAKLEAETETARQVLLANIEVLKKKLKEQNLEIETFDVEVVSTETNGTNDKQQAGLPVAKNKSKSEHVDYYS